MGYEYRYVAPPPTPAQWQQVLACFEQADELGLVPVSKPNHQLLSASYAYEHPQRADWPDDLVVAADAQGVYVLFQAATAQQRAGTLARLDGCLRAVGLAGDFEEL